MTPVVLTAQDAPTEGPAFLQATVLPARGMMLLQARLRLPSGEVVDALHTPPDLLAAFGGPDDFNGNASFSGGGALLAPFANRIVGRDAPGAREIVATVAGETVRLPRNWGGKAPGAPQYAMHGLILDAAFTVTATGPDRIAARLEAGDFGGRWPSRTRLDVQWRLTGGALTLRAAATNVGEAPLPFGFGWHPYFALPSGAREQARLHLPAARRTEVTDYDAVLPTGRLLDVAGTPYDFNSPRPLGALYLDDCFTALRPDGGQAVTQVLDPAAQLGLRIASPAPPVKAVQVYAPPDQPFVVVEPQFNLADPYGSEWAREIDTGMAQAPPGASIAYAVDVSAFTLGTGLSSEG